MVIRTIVVTKLTNCEGCCHVSIQQERQLIHNYYRGHILACEKNSRILSDLSAVRHEQHLDNSYPFLSMSVPAKDTAQIYYFIYSRQSALPQPPGSP